MILAETAGSRTSQGGFSFSYFFIDPEKWGTVFRTRFMPKTKNRRGFADADSNVGQQGSITGTTLHEEAFCP